MSLLSSRTSGAVGAPHRDVVRRAEAGVRGRARRPRRAGQRRADRVDRSVARRVVHDARSASSRAGAAAKSDARQRERIRPRVVADDDDVEVLRHVSGLPPPRAPCGPSSRPPSRSSAPRRAASGGDERGVARASLRSSASASATRSTSKRHEPRGVAVDLARNRRVEQHRRHAVRDGLERRHAEAFVVRQERKDARAGVQRVELGVRDVLAPLDASRRRPTRPRSRAGRCAAGVRLSPTRTSCASGHAAGGLREAGSARERDGG